MRGLTCAMASSYYQSTLSPTAEAWPSLQGCRQARVCVVGGGFAGLNTALGLVERGVRDVVLLESARVGFGASGRNGGFVFGGFSLGEQALLDQSGPERARALYEGTTAAVDRIRRRIIDYRIDCDHVESGVIWANWFRDPAVLLKRQRLLEERFGAEWSWLPRDRLRQLIHSDRYGDGLFEQGAFHFHPLKYAIGLAEAICAGGAGVYERSAAVGLERRGASWRVRTAQGEVDAEHVVLACGGYLAGLRRTVDASVLPIATYVMVTEPLGTRMGEIMATRAAVYDTRFAFDYYRPLPDTRLLWGGRISVRDRQPEAVKRLLRRDLLKVFPQLDGVGIDYAWSGLMSYARHQMPQIGRIEAGLWVAQAFGGHGVAPTTFAGETLASAIAGQDPRWKDFSGYGLVSAHKPVGLLAAQLSYWQAQLKDAWKARMEKWHE